MTENPPLATHEVELEIEVTMKQPRQNRFFWIFYRVFGVLIMLGTVNGILSTIVMKEPFAIGSFALPVLWFGPVFFRKNYARIAATWAMAVIAILWGLHIYFSILRFEFMTTHRAEGPNWGDSPVAFLGTWAIEIVFIIMPLTILLLSGIGPLIRCFKDENQ